MNQIPFVCHQKQTNKNFEPGSKLCLWRHRISPCMTKGCVDELASDRQAALLQLMDVVMRDQRFLLLYHDVEPWIARDEYFDINILFTEADDTKRTSKVGTLQEKKSSSLRFVPISKFSRQTKLFWIEDAPVHLEGWTWLLVSVDMKTVVAASPVSSSRSVVEHNRIFMVAVKHDWKALRRIEITSSEH